MKYIKQLDTLRAIAVLLVVFSHWVPSKSSVFGIPLGFVGVNIFFVLSGFLITSILLKNKQLAIDLGIGKKQLIKNFYAKRVLRIFPIYYITVFLLFFFKNNLDTNIENSIGYHLTYTSNFYYYTIQDWDPAISHLWSLSVEEQFYLIWPWIILLIKNKPLKKVIYVFIGIGLFSQIIAMDSVWNIILPNSNFDAFGLGALLSWNFIFDKDKINDFYKKLTRLTILILIIFISAMIVIMKLNLGLLNANIPFVVSLLTLWLLITVILNKDSKSILFKYLWNNRALIFLGKISYGIYLFHNILPFVTSKFKEYLPVITHNSHLKVLSYLLWDFTFLILISWLSFKLIEKPFLKLKKNFRLKST